MSERTRNFTFMIPGVTCFQIACLETYNCVGMGYFTIEEDEHLNLYGWVRHQYPKYARAVSAYLGALALPCGGILPEIIELYSEKENYVERGWRPGNMPNGRSLSSIFEETWADIVALVDLGMEDEIENRYPNVYVKYKKNIKCVIADKREKRANEECKTPKNLP